MEEMAATLMLLHFFERSSAAESPVRVVKQQGLGDPLRMAKKTKGLAMTPNKCSANCQPRARAFRLGATPPPVQRKKRHAVKAKLSGTS